MAMTKDEFIKALCSHFEGDPAEIIAEYDRLKKQNAEAIAFLRKTAQLNQKYANLILADQEFFIAVEGALRKSKAATEDVLQALKENENDKG